MHSLDLITNGPKAILTRTDTTTVDGKDTHLSYPCDLDGKRIDRSEALPIFQDRLSGLTVVRVSETMPFGSSAMEAKADAIRALNPIHYSSPDGKVKGYFVVAPDFNNREHSLSNSDPAKLPEANKAA